MPPTPYRYDFERGELAAPREPDIDFAFDGYETTQLFATSRDGTRVPLFVTRRRGRRGGSPDVAAAGARRERAVRHGPSGGDIPTG